MRNPKIKVFGAREHLVDTMAEAVALAAIESRRLGSTIYVVAGEVDEHDGSWIPYQDGPAIPITTAKEAIA